MNVINNRLFLILGLRALVGAVPYDGPVPTQAGVEFAGDGWTPKPTSRPVTELFQREDPTLCGYLAGDGSGPVTCDLGQTCMYDDLFSWFGCCTGTAVTDCEVITDCVESTSAAACLADSSCANDPLGMICTDSDKPACAFLYSTVDASTYGHFVCGASAVTAEVFATATDKGSSSAPAVSLSKVTAGTSAFTKAKPSSVGGDVSSGTIIAASSKSGQGSSTTATTAKGSAQGQASSTSTSGLAAGTATALLGAAGGVAGLVLLVV